MGQADEKREALFIALISGYVTQAMVALGKIADPVTGETRRELGHVSALIDILAMLEAKTEGNRTDQETSSLRHALSTLRLNYVEEVNKPDPEKKEDAKPSASEESGDQ